MNISSLSRRPTRNSATFQCVAALFLGVIAAAGLPPFDLWPVSLIAILYALRTAISPSGRVLIGSYVAFFFGYHGVSFIWIYDAITISSDNPFTSPSVLIQGTAPIGGKALLFGLPLFVAVRLSRKCGLSGFALAACILPLAVGLIEALLTIGPFGGVPLGPVIATQGAGPLTSLIPVFGATGAGVVMLSLLGAAAWATCARNLSRWVVPSLGVPGIAALAPVDWTTPVDRSQNILAFGSGFPVREERPLGAVLENAIAARASVTEPVDLVVLPELAFKQPLDDAALTSVGPPLREQLGGAEVLTGYTYRSDGAFFNAYGTVGAARQAYYKRHLVPLYEAEILPGLTRFLTGPPPDTPRFRHGAADQAPLSINGVTFGVMICWEAAFPADTSYAEADILMIASSDTWASSRLGQSQMVQMARLRALETGRPVVRAATNGRSAFLSHRGEILDSTDTPGTAIVATVQGRTGQTPIMALGHGTVMLGLVGFLGGVAAVQAVRSRRHRVPT